MKNQFAVYADTFFQRLMFEGSKVEVYAWLNDMREFDEQMEKRQCFTELQIRIFVRDEVSKALESAAEAISDLVIPETSESEQVNVRESEDQPTWQHRGR